MRTQSAPSRFTISSTTPDTSTTSPANTGPTKAMSILSALVESSAAPAVQYLRDKGERHQTVGDRPPERPGFCVVGIDMDRVEDRRSPAHKRRSSLDRRDGREREAEFPTAFAVLLVIISVIRRGPISM